MPKMSVDHDLSATINQGYEDTIGTYCHYSTIYLLDLSKVYLIISCNVLFPCCFLFKLIQIEFLEMCHYCIIDCIDNYLIWNIEITGRQQPISIPLYLCIQFHSYIP